MSYESYSDQMKNPLWQKKRLHMLESKGWKCEVCGAEEKTLHVHHKQYKSGAKIWEYEDNELAVLCEECHNRTHGVLNDLKEFIFRLPADKLGYFSSFLKAADKFFEFTTEFKVSLPDMIHCPKCFADYLKASIALALQVRIDKADELFTRIILIRDESIRKKVMDSLILTAQQFAEFPEGWGETKEDEESE